MFHKIEFLQSILDRTSPVLNMAAIVALPARWADTLKKSINTSIPDGYEDDSGFHFGIDPEIKKQS